MKFDEIPQFPNPHYSVDVVWWHLEAMLTLFSEMGLDLDPDFQRGHVWTLEQRIAYIEFSLRGGESARTIYFNSYDTQSLRDLVLIDGKQRLTSVRMFLKGEVPAFGEYISAMGKIPTMFPRLSFSVFSMPDRAAVLCWYLAMNAGGSVHGKEEIARVQRLLQEEERKA